ncbi:MAG: hypothetical protein JWL76_243 [Thermoleophilia bacterium]|nr:hypothetical protein [Thermoleophilia bacterium]
MTMQSVLARLPGFLSGPAGTAIKPIEHVAASAAAYRPVLEGLADGTLSAGRAGELFRGVASDLSVDAAWSGIVKGRPALEEALGTSRATRVVHAIQGALSDLQTPIIKAHVAERYADEAKLVTDGSRDHAAYMARIDADAYAKVGGPAPLHLQQAMLDDVLPQLEQVAARTATTRLAVGAMGVTAASLGASALIRRDDAPASPTVPRIHPFPAAPVSAPWPTPG